MLFSEVFVQDSLKRLLIGTVKGQRVSHAQLFLGQEGTHALGLALAYAQYINCTRKTESDACGICSSCVKYNNLAHPDLHFFFPNSTTKAVSKDNESSRFYNEWRELFKPTKGLFSLDDWFAKLGVENKQAIINKLDVERILELQTTKSYEADYKVFIIWLPEKIYASMAHKLLKCLEEPDGKTLFLLVSENQEQILPTILSRLQLVKIPKFNTQQFVELVAQKTGCSRDRAVEIANLTDNNLVDAFNEQRYESDVNEYYTLFVSMMRSAYRICYFTAQPAKVLFPETIALVKQLEGLGRERQKSFLQYALVLCRKCILMNAGGGQLVQSSAEEAAWLTNFHPYINQRNGDKVMEVINDAIRDIGMNAHAGILFTDLILLLGQLIQMGDEKLQSL
jgi:DNA polymerase-3 subunit delta'